MLLESVVVRAVTQVSLRLIELTGSHRVPRRTSRRLLVRRHYHVAAVDLNAGVQLDDLHKIGAL